MNNKGLTVRQYIAELQKLSEEDLDKPLFFRDTEDESRFFPIGAPGAKKKTIYTNGDLNKIPPAGYDCECSYGEFISKDEADWRNKDGKKYESVEVILVTTHLEH